jgi:hypothetical protein
MNPECRVAPEDNQAVKCGRAKQSANMLAHAYRSFDAGTAGVVVHVNPIGAETQVYDGIIGETLKRQLRIPLRHPSIKSVVQK